MSAFFIDNSRHFGDTTNDINIYFNVFKQIFLWACTNHLEL